MPTPPQPGTGQRLSIWQADHTELDVLVIDANGTPARPMVDHCGGRLLPRGRRLHGIPDVLYANHGSDFTSDHLAQVALRSFATRGLFATCLQITLEAGTAVQAAIDRHMPGRRTKYM